MTRIRASVLIAILFCVGVLLCSIGHVVGREDNKVYEAPDLMLTQGQATYDLCDGITYNGDEYKLSVSDQGGFDINAPGSYTVGYQLTPLNPDGERGPGHEETLKPKETVGSKETAAPGEKPKETAAPETTGAKETTAPKETTEPKETTAPKETTEPKETTAPKETTEPKETTAPKETTEPKETTAPKETTGPKETVAPKETPVSKETSAQKETTAPKETVEQKETSAPEQVKTPEAVHEAEKAADTSNTIKIQGESVPLSVALTLDALNKGGHEKTASIQQGDGKLLLAEGVSALDAVTVQENASVPEKAPVVEKALALEDAHKPGSVSAVLTQPTAPQAQSGSVSAVPTQPTVPQAQSGSVSAVPTQPTAPQAQDATSAPTQPAAPQAQPDATSAPTQPTAPQAQDATSAPAHTTAPQKTQAQENGTGLAKEPAKASSSQANPNRKPIFFTRTIVVKEAVQYQNARFDVDTLTNLLTGMDFDQTHYSLSVLDDGGFNGSRINEYHIIYRLVNTDDGKKVADLERYVWITAPGVTFDAPDLELQLNQTGYDLQEGIDYDSAEYALTTVDPESVDTSVAGEQRAMFQMTALPEDAGLPEASPSQASPSIAGDPSGSETASGPDGVLAEKGSSISAGVTRKTEGDSVGSFASRSADKDGTFSETGTVTRPVLAVFGRKVKVESEPVVVIHAPPLILKAGTEAGHNLLEGVTATDEDGTPVPLEVANRSELDQAAEGIASAVPPKGDASDQEAEGATPADAKPGIPELFSLFAFRSSGLDKSSLMKMGSIPGLAEDKAKQNESSAPAGTEIPSDLPPAKYKVLLSAVHPVTGETFTVERSVEVLGGAQLVQLYPGTYERNVAEDHRPIEILSGDVTLTLKGVGSIDPYDANGSPITVTPTGHLTLILANGANVTLKGKAGETGLADHTNALGGGAGIFVQEHGATLTIRGNGKLVAYGGSAGPGGLADNHLRGGGGGGGAGAAIGGAGGNGGAGGYQSHANGGDGAPGHIPDSGSIKIEAPNVTRVNGLGNSLTPLERYNGGANGGGGMPADISSWDAGFAGGSGGGGGGAGSSSLSSYGGFGQGFGRYPDVRKNASGDGGYGGYSLPNVRIALDAENDPYRLGFNTLGEVFTAIKQDAAKGIRKNYTITLLGDYTYTEQDNASLQQLTDLNKNVTVTLTGVDTPENDPSKTRYSLHVPGGNITFPFTVDSADSGAFVMQNIYLIADPLPGSSYGYGDVCANGSKLTMGTQIDNKNSSWRIWAGTSSKEKGKRIQGNVTVYDHWYDGLYGANTSGDGSKLTLQGNCVVNFISDWDTVNVADGAKLNVLSSMDLCGTTRSIGAIVLGARSKLTMSNTNEAYASKAGLLQTTGDNATLEFARKPSSDKQAILTLSGRAPTALQAHPVTLRYSSMGDGPVSGDKLIQYLNAVTNADTKSFINGFGGVWGIKADQTTGFVSMEKRNVWVDYPSSSGKPRDFYGSLGRAMDAVRTDNPPGGKSGTYTLTLIENYILDQNDQKAFGNAAGMPQVVTVKITGKDAKNPGIPVKTLTLSADMILPRGSANERGAAFEINNIIIARGEGGWIAANGSKLTLGDGITTVTNEQKLFPNVVGGVLERSDVAKNLTFTGNTWLEVRSGHWNNVVGGNWHYWSQGTTRDDPAVSTIVGNTSVSVKGTALAEVLCGGSWLDTGSSTYSAARRDGDSIVSFTGNDPWLKIVAGGYGAKDTSLIEDSTTGLTQVLLNNAQVWTVYGAPGTLAKGLSKQGRVELGISGTVSVGAVTDFGAVHLRQNANLTVTETMYQFAHYADDASQPDMLLDFQGNANLTLEKTGGIYGNNRAGSFRIEGTGNTLTLPRASGKAIPLVLDRPAPNVRVDNARLELRYAEGVAVQPGDTLLYFNPTKQNAAAADYAPEIGGFAVMADKRTGYVFAGSAVTVQETGKKLQFYPSLARAMDAIGEGIGEYTVTFRKEEYKLTPDDGIALATQGGKASKITYTSQFVTTADDVLEPGEKVGDTVMRTLIVGDGTTAASPKSDLYLNSHTSVVKNVRFKYLQEGCALYVNGHSLVVGPHVEILSDAGYYPVIYGGAKNQPVASTDMTIQSGRYNGIYGGGREAGATVTGNTSVKFGGDAELVGSMYGGGEEGKVIGTASVEITGGKALAADAASGTKNTVVGGGKTGTVGGASVTISGGSANGTIEVAGCDGGNVLGDVNLYVKESPGSPPPKAALGNFYGASLRQKASGAGTVAGNIHITITNGKDYGTIWGGKSGITGAGKSSDITFKGGSVKVQDITDFDTLNLGDPAAPSNKTSLFLTGKLQGEKGSLKFWDGSVLTLQGTSMNPADLVVKNIQTDHTAVRSHLHMYKGPGAKPSVSVTRPLNVTGENTSAPGDKLILGEYGPGGGEEGDKVGQAGDRLLAFKTAGKANVQSYISDLQGLDIIPSATEPGVLELGLSLSPKIALKAVRHTTQTGSATQADQPGKSVTKTLTFQIDSFQDAAPAKPGGAITSAYVNTDWKPDPAWEEGGAIPAGGQKITVKQNSPGSVQWSGTVTMAITPPINPTPVYYFAHVRDENNRVRTVVLDVHSPVEQGDAAVSRDGEGNYTFTVKLKDRKPEKVGSPDIVYNVSGLKQLAWAAGKVRDPVPAGQAAALAPVMTQGGQLKQVVTLGSPSIDSYSWTFTVPAGVLGKDPTDMAVYVYAKDAMGNTGMYVILLNDNRMDIEVPLWAGTAALRGGDAPHLLAPDLYVVNWSEKPVKAELVGAEIPENQGKPGDGKLLLTSKRSGPWANNELNLMVKPTADSSGKDYFAIISVKDINPVTNALNLGIMPGRNSANHGVSFTFAALYDEHHIIRTSGWSQCQLTYRFSLVPSAPPPAS